MSNRRFEMYQYRQIIVHLRLGESIRGIAHTKLADRKTIRKIFKIAKQRGWLEASNELPDDNVLAQFLGQPRPQAHFKSSIIPYQKQIETWHRQGIQATTIHTALQRQYGFKGEGSFR